jgi:hypothetical protein
MERSLDLRYDNTAMGENMKAELRRLKHMDMGLGLSRMVDA